MMTTLKPCPFCGSEPIFRNKKERYFVFCNGCCIVSNSFTSKEQAVVKWNHRADPWSDTANAPQGWKAVDLWLNGYRVTNCLLDETKEEWTEGWLDAEGKHQSFPVMWVPPTYWMLIPESPEE
jgi:Lar family restriction alleviation protein